MSTQSNAMPESPVESQVIAPATTSPTRPLYWSLRRELWENRYVYMAPLAVAAVFLFGHLISVMDWSEFSGGAQAVLNYRSRVVLLSERLGVPAGLLVGTVAGLKSVDALERAPAAAAIAPWTVARYRDADGRVWEEVDLVQVVAEASFLRVEAA